MKKYVVIIFTQQYETCELEAESEEEARAEALGGNATRILGTPDSEVVSIVEVLGG